MLPSRRKYVLQKQTDTARDYANTFLSCAAERIFPRKHVKKVWHTRDMAELIANLHNCGGDNDQVPPRDIVQIRTVALAAFHGTIFGMNV